MAGTLAAEERAMVEVAIDSCIGVADNSMNARVQIYLFYLIFPEK